MFGSIYRDILLIQVPFFQKFANKKTPPDIHNTCSNGLCLHPRKTAVPTNLIPPLNQTPDSAPQSPEPRPPGCPPSHGLHLRGKLPFSFPAIMYVDHLLHY